MGNEDEGIEGVRRRIYEILEAKRRKDFSLLSSVKLEEGFTKFDEFPPYTRQGAREAFIYEQAAVANLGDFNYKIRDLRIDLFPPIAVATFILDYSAIVVDDYSFTGREVKRSVRATEVFILQGKEWKLVHEHLSPLPEKVQADR